MAYLKFGFDREQEKNYILTFFPLILIAILGFFHRQDNDRVQSIPALVVGIGLICSNTFSRTKRRKKLLNEMLNRRNALN